MPRNINARMGNKKFIALLPAMGQRIFCKDSTSACDGTENFLQMGNNKQNINLHILEVEQHLSFQLGFTLKLQSFICRKLSSVGDRNNNGIQFQLFNPKKKKHGTQFFSAKGVIFSPINTLCCLPLHADDTSRTLSANPDC